MKVTIEESGICVTVDVTNHEQQIDSSTLGILASDLIAKIKNVNQKTTEGEDEDDED